MLENRLEVNTTIRVNIRIGFQIFNVPIYNMYLHDGKIFERA